jgi:hypothetical protein
MKLLTRTRQLAPVSVDAVAAVIGGTADELVKRFGEVGRDFMDRPTIAFEHAQLAHSEWVAAVDRDYRERLGFELYQDDWRSRRREAAGAATARAREAFIGPHRGGQETQRYMQVQWDAERVALAEFDAANPEITLSEFRQRRTK